MIFVGMSAGPAVGSSLIQATGDLLSPFYLALTAHFIVLTMLLFFLPESLSHESQMRMTAAQEQAEELAEASSTEQKPRLASKIVKGASAFLSPLAIFIPKKREIGDVRRGRNWNLTFLVGAYGIIISFIVSSYLTSYEFH